LRAHAGELVGIHAGEVIGVVGLKLVCRLLIARINRGKLAGVDAVHPRSRVSVGVERRNISPLGKHGLVSSGHVLDVLSHPHGKVVLSNELRIAIFELNELLLELEVA